MAPPAPRPEAAALRSGLMCSLPSCIAGLTVFLGEATLLNTYSLTEALHAVTASGQQLHMSCSFCYRYQVSGILYLKLREILKYISVTIQKSVRSFLRPVRHKTWLYVDQITFNAQKTHFQGQRRCPGSAG